MSRTVRRPFATNASGKGEKIYKRFHSSQERRRVRDAIAIGNYDIGHQLILWNEYDTCRDGKKYDNRLTILTVLGTEKVRAVMTWRQAELKARQLFAQLKTPIGVWREGWSRICIYDGRLKFF
jgi:hypothetical protein